MSYEPDMPGAQRSNVFNEHTFKLRVTFGAASIASYRSKDATIARTGAGAYTVTLPKPYEALTDFAHGFIEAAGAILFCTIRTNNVATDGTILVETVTEAGAATDPDSGSVLFLTLGASTDVLNTKFVG